MPYDAWMGEDHRAFADTIRRFLAEEYEPNRAAWTSDGGDMKTEAFLRPRRSIREGMGIAEVRAILTAPEPALRRLRRRAAMLRKRLL